MENPRSRCHQIRFLAKLLFRACKVLPSLCVLTQPFFSWVVREREREREKSLVSSSSYKALIPSWRLYSPPHLKLINYLPKAPSPNTITLEIRASAYDSCGDMIQSITDMVSFLPQRDLLCCRCLLS